MIYEWVFVGDDDCHFAYSLEEAEQRLAVGYLLFRAPSTLFASVIEEDHPSVCPF